MIEVHTQPGTILRIALYKRLGTDPKAAVEEGRSQGILGLFPDESDAVVATNHFARTAKTVIQGTRQLLLRSREMRLARMQSSSHANQDPHS